MKREYVIEDKKADVVVKFSLVETETGVDVIAENNKGESVTVLGFVKDTGEVVLYREVGMEGITTDPSGRIIVN